MPLPKAVVEAGARALARRDGWSDDWSSTAACAYEEMARACFAAMASGLADAWSEDEPETRALLRCIATLAEEDS